MTIKLNPKQRERIARGPSIQYTGPMSEFNNYLKSDPAKEAIYKNIVTQIDEKLQTKVAKGGSIKRKKMAQGGLTYDELYQGVLGRSADAAGKKYWKEKFGDTIDPDEVTQFAQGAKASVEQGVETGGSYVATEDSLNALRQKANLAAPEAPTVGQVATPVTPEQQVKFTPVEDIATVTAKQAKPAEVAPTIDPREAAKMEAEKIAPKVGEEVAKVTPAVGEIKQDALVEAQTVQATDTALNQSQAAKINQAVQIDTRPIRKVQAEEMIDGPTVKMARVEEQLERTKAAQAEIDPLTTVQGQLDKLYKDFEAGNPPAWAASSMRNVTAILNQRGLGASSIAGQAIVQATMEAALPIAQQDSRTLANLQIQNLSNRQQVALLGAEQRAKFLGIEFDQEFQTKVANASRIADIANQNFTAEVQVTLENAKMAQTVDLANLNNEQAVTMAKVAQIANLETTNLNNRQQAAVQNAQSFLQMDLTNLGFEQQTAMFKAEKVIQSMLTDQAAENTARQINAASENQVNQFYDSLATQISTFNVEQKNAQERFNTQQFNAVEEFNVAQRNNIAQFNASNGLAVSQSNAEWRRQIATADTAMQNQINMFNAQNALGITLKEYENVWQNYRDQMAFAWQTADNEADRYATLATQIVKGEQDLNATKYAQKKEGERNVASLLVEVFKTFYP